MPWVPEVSPDHPYAGDLDIIGRASLFQLLDTTATRMGRESLAAWLLAPADPTEATARQGAVAELASRQIRVGMPADIRELEPVVERLILGLLAAGDGR